MMAFCKSLLTGVLAASLLLPATALASAKHRARITVHPKRAWHGYGFLPGYHPQPALSDWRDRSTQQARNEPRYWRFGPGWYGGRWEYGYGRPGFYRGRWNGGSFGPCWTQTPIGPMWNCGR